ncbi:MAG: hypothetical protein JW958_13850 [Candidatus Eisenbacteria bacterium]|nr:hypothetical protein [Candidatus Eisenbacteria bacterium]
MNAPTRRYNARVTAREETAPGRLLLRVLPDAPHRVFEPGQYLPLGLFAREGRAGDVPPASPDPPPDRLIRRPYSMTSRPDEGEREFYISLVPDGALTPRLFALRAGDPLWIAPVPRGAFTASPVPPDRGLILIAAGTGVAPFVSMIRSRSAGDPRRWALLHGARRAGELGFREELESSARGDGRLLYFPAVTRPGPEERWNGPMGRVNVFLDDGSFERAFGETIEPGRHHVFLCGAPDMVHDLRERFEARGFTLADEETGSGGDLHVDSF